MHTTSCAGAPSNTGLASDRCILRHEQHIATHLQEAVCHGLDNHNLLGVADGGVQLGLHALEVLGLDPNGEGLLRRVDAGDLRMEMGHVCSVSTKLPSRTDKGKPPKKRRNPHACALDLPKKPARSLQSNAKNGSESHARTHEKYKQSMLT